MTLGDILVHGYVTMAALGQEDKPSKLGVWRESLGPEGTSSDQNPGSFSYVGDCTIHWDYIRPL